MEGNSFCWREKRKLQIKVYKCLLCVKWDINGSNNLGSRSQLFTISPQNLNFELIQSQSCLYLPSFFFESIFGKKKLSLLTFIWLTHNFTRILNEKVKFQIYTKMLVFFVSFLALSSFRLIFEVFCWHLVTRFAFFYIYWSTIMRFLVEADLIVFSHVSYILYNDNYLYILFSFIDEI